MTYNITLTNGTVFELDRPMTRYEGSRDTIIYVEKGKIKEKKAYGNYKLGGLSNLIRSFLRKKEWTMVYDHIRKLYIVERTVRFCGQRFFEFFIRSVEGTLTTIEKRDRSLNNSGMTESIVLWPTVNQPLTGGSKLWQRVELVDYNGQILDRGELYKITGKLSFKRSEIAVITYSYSVSGAFYPTKRQALEAVGLNADYGNSFDRKRKVENIAISYDDSDMRNELSKYVGSNEPVTVRRENVEKSSKKSVYDVVTIDYLTSPVKGKYLVGDTLFNLYDVLEIVKQKGEVYIEIM